jgi:hypothetical protein
LLIFDFVLRRLRAHLLKSAIVNRKSKINGGKGIRTPDFQLAKLALYQLSYAPERIAEFRLPIFDCKEEKTNAGCRSYGSASGLRAPVGMAKLRSCAKNAAAFFFC